ncbi:MAG: lipocalin-like domain-containing protein, partial [Rhodobacteraceae bacterium]|nr:lipocalin-like domain-containing protein [Paracoccaceae bacterium]
YINYGDDGRMLVLIVGHDRTRPAGKVATDAEAASLFRSMVSYGGTWEFDGTTMLHLVDISWGESWTGTRQKRRVTIAGDNLVLSSGPDPDPIDGVYSIRRMTWRRLPAPTT